MSQVRIMPVTHGLRLPVVFGAGNWGSQPLCDWTIHRETMKTKDNVI